MIENPPRVPISGLMSSSREDSTRDPAFRGGDAAPVIVIHCLAHAVAALSVAEQAGRTVVLASAPDAGISAGAGWFAALIAEARAAAPAVRFAAVLDCGGDAGAAQAAIRAGVEAIIYTGRADVADRLADIAAQAGVRLATVRPNPALDLGGDFFARPEALVRRCADAFGAASPAAPALSQFGAKCPKLRQ